MTDTPERQPFRVACTRCWRDEPASLQPNIGASEALAGWHQTDNGWVCAHCWTAVDRRVALGLCRLCGRGAHADESERGGEWRRPNDSGELICPECHFAGRDWATIQAMKELVPRWQLAGVLARYRGLVDDALERERKMIIAMLRARVEQEDGDWDLMVGAAVEAARRRWPKPVGQS